MIWNRDAYLDYLFARRVERPMLVELFGPLIGLEDEWREQGATEAERRLDAFDFDTVRRIGAGVRCGPLLTPSVTVEDTPERRVERDGLGRTLLLDKRTATIPLPMDFPVADFDGWERVKPLFLFDEGRLDAARFPEVRRARDDGALVEVGIPGGYDTARELMGEMNTSLAFYDQPELLHDIMTTLADTCVAALDRATREITIDRVAIHEDFAGRSGPLLGPDQFRTFLTPYYRRVWELMQSRGATLFGIDSDGYVTPVIDALLDAGINELFPNEPAAGMDIASLRARYGQRLILRGGIDKHALRRTRDDIDRELDRRITPVTTAGGVVFGLDHRIPNGVSIQNYRYYVDTARSRLGLPPRNADSPSPWQRTA